MGVRIEFDSGALTAFIEGEIDHHEAKKIREKIDENISSKRPRLTNLDFSKVQFMDSSGIGLIMGRYKLMAASKGKLKVINIPERIERMVKLSGLVKLGIF